MVFLTANQCVFKNTDQKKICASIFLKLNQGRNTKKICWGAVFKKTPRTYFLGGPKQQFFKLKFQICFSEFVLSYKRKLHADFHTKDQGWEFAHLISERIVRFLSKNEQMSDSFKKFWLKNLKSCFTMFYLRLKKKFEKMSE